MWNIHSPFHGGHWIDEDIPVDVHWVGLVKNWVLILQTEERKYNLTLCDSFHTHLTTSRSTGFHFQYNRQLVNIIISAAPTVFNLTDPKCWFKTKSLVLVSDTVLEKQLTCPAVSTSWRLKSWPFTLTNLLKAEAGEWERWVSFTKHFFTLSEIYRDFETSRT